MDENKDIQNKENIITNEITIKDSQSPEIINSNKIISESIDQSEKYLKKNVEGKEKYQSSFNISVGKIHDGLVTLLSEDLNILEIPLSILPNDIRKGNILKFSIERNIEEEENRKNDIIDMQKYLIEDENLFLKNSQ